jgi:hypothetical protein
MPSNDFFFSTFWPSGDQGKKGNERRKGGEKVKLSVEAMEEGRREETGEESEREQKGEGLRGRQEGAE